MKSYDVYSYGVVSSSTLYLLQDDFPARSGYAEIARRYDNVGGEAANSSLVLARLGVKVKLDGNWLNPDDDAQFLREVFGKHQVDITRIAFRECQGPKEMLVVDAHTRTIFGTYAQLLAEKSWNMPARSDIQQAAVVSLDPFFGAASLQVADYARSENKPIVTVDCKFDDPIFLASDTAIIAEEFLRDAYPDDDVATVTREYQARSGGTVIFTFGHREIIYGSRGEPFRRVTPFEISPVDTTGAGDSFRAGIIYGRLQQWPTRKSIEFASALAALVCQSFPGVLHSPTVDAVTAFIESRAAA